MPALSLIFYYLLTVLILIGYASPIHAFAISRQLSGENISSINFLIADSKS
jgi:hypothetical protein